MNYYIAKYFDKLKVYSRLLIVLIPLNLYIYDDIFYNIINNFISNKAISTLLTAIANLIICIYFAYYKVPQKTFKLLLRNWNFAKIIVAIIFLIFCFNINLSLQFYILNLWKNEFFRMVLGDLIGIFLISWPFSYIDYPRKIQLMSVNTDMSMEEIISLFVIDNEYELISASKDCIVIKSSSYIYKNYIMFEKKGDLMDITGKLALDHIENIFIREKNISPDLIKKYYDKDKLEEKVN